jgi:hypothetical protein
MNLDEIMQLLCYVKVKLNYVKFLKNGLSYRNIHVILYSMWQGHDADDVRNTNPRSNILQNILCVLKISQPSYVSLILRYYSSDYSNHEG